jgi:hypothetical protein
MSRQLATASGDSDTGSVCSECRGDCVEFVDATVVHVQTSCSMSLQWLTSTT